MSNSFVSIKINHDVGSEPILIPRSKLNAYLPPLIKATKANVLLTPNQIFKGIDGQSYNYCTIASFLSSPLVFVLNQLSDIEIETKERELSDQFEQKNQQASNIANQLFEEQDNLSMKQQTKTKKKKMKKNKQIVDNVSKIDQIPSEIIFDFLFLSYAKQVRG